MMQLKMFSLERFILQRDGWTPIQINWYTFDNNFGLMWGFEALGLSFYLDSVLLILSVEGVAALFSSFKGVPLIQNFIHFQILLRKLPSTTLMNYFYFTYI